MKPPKTFWIGFAIGVVLVPVTTLGLIIPYIGEIGRFILAVPRLLTELLLDTQTAPGALNLLVLATLSGLFFGGIGWLIALFRAQTSEAPAEGVDSK